MVARSAFGEPYFGAVAPKNLADSTAQAQPGRVWRSLGTAVSALFSNGGRAESCNSLEKIQESL